MKQWKILEKIEKELKINVCTCGNCGEVLLIDISKYLADIKCPHCSIIMEYSDMPDLFTQGDKI